MRDRRKLKKNPPLTVRALLDEAYGSVYSIYEFIEKFILPTLSKFQREEISRKCSHLVISSISSDDSLPSFCEALNLSSTMYHQLQILFRETLITAASQEIPSLNKVRQPLTPPSQSLVSLIQDIVWTVLQQRNKKFPDRTNPSRSSANGTKHLLCQGYTVGHPTTMTTGLKVQKQINSATEYCSTSSLFRLLHTILLGDDILRFLLLNFNVFIPILPFGDSCNDDTDLESRQRKRSCIDRDDIVYNYWQVAGIPFQSFNSAKAKQNCANIATSSKDQTSNMEKATADGLSNNDVVVSSIQSVVPTMQVNPTALSKSKNTRKKKRKRPIAGFDFIYDQVESTGSLPHSLSPKACLCRKALFYSNSYTSTVGTQGLFMISSSFNPLSQKAIMSPIQLWNSMTKEWIVVYQILKSTSSQMPISPNVLEMCANILRRHCKNTDYHRLLQRHCPLPCASKASNLSAVASLSELAYQYSSPDGVIHFVQACLQSVIPDTFWGGASSCTSIQNGACELGKDQRSNKSIFLHQIVPLFINLRRNERMANKLLLRNIRITKMTWIMSTDNERRSKATRLDHECLKLQVLSIFRWLFHSYIVPLLQQCFYVTESEIHGKRVLYYRKPVWALFRTLSMNKLLDSSTKENGDKKKDGDLTSNTITMPKNSQYIELTEADVLGRLLHGDQQMGVCRLRLLPKATGVRPIATLNKREFITPVVQTSNSTKDLNTLSEFLDLGALDLNDDGEMDTPMGPVRKKSRFDVLAATVSSFTHSDLPATLPPTRIRLDNQSRASTNMMLSDIFSVLTFERDRKKQAFASGLMGMHDFYPRYRSFIQLWKKIDSPFLNGLTHEKRSLQQLYFGSVDIRHCYDNIDQEHLLAIIGNSILTEEHYVIQKYSVYKPERHSDSPLTVKWQSKKDVSLLEQLEPFSSKVRVFSQDKCRSIFVDGVNTVVINKEQIMKQLRAHLTSHLVVTKGRYGNRYLLQSTGIPQGSILSTILCNFYYGDVERRLFETQVNENGTCVSGSTRRLMSRMVDDFLLVTTNAADLRRFFVTMHRGDSDLGVTINQEKTNSSIPMKITLEKDATDRQVSEIFEIRSSNSIDSSGSYFSWCGMMFDTHSGEVRIDYSRFVDGRGGDSLTVDRVSHEGDQLMAQMKQFVRPRCLPIMYDPMINSTQGRMVNYYQMMVYTAVKTSEYLKSLQHERYPLSSTMSPGQQNSVFCNVPFLIQCIEETILFGSDLIQIRVHTIAYHGHDSTTDPRAQKESLATAPFLPRDLTQWLGWRSFYDVFRMVKTFRQFAEIELSRRVLMTSPGTKHILHVEATVQHALESMDLTSLLSTNCR